jgi:hypothetical protein
MTKKSGAQFRRVSKVRHTKASKTNGASTQTKTPESIYRFESRMIDEVLDQLGDCNTNEHVIETLESLGERIRETLGPGDVRFVGMSVDRYLKLPTKRWLSHSHRCVTAKILRLLRAGRAIQIHALAPGEE